VEIRDRDLFTYYPLSRETEENRRILCQDSRFSVRDLNPVPTEYMAKCNVRLLVSVSVKCDSCLRASFQPSTSLVSRASASCTVAH
jgi:hypothetical protein